jgi:hypothetical protein
VTGHKEYVFYKGACSVNSPVYCDVRDVEELQNMCTFKSTVLHTHFDFKMFVIYS